MPKQYESIRDKFTGEGMGLKEAKTRAAKIYNAKHKERPVHPGMKYAKGGDIQVAAYAAGGPVLGRERDFLKIPDDFRSAEHGSGKTDEVYGKSLQGKGGGNDGETSYVAPKTKGETKVLKTVKPRK